MELGSNGGRFALVEDFERLGPQVDLARGQLGIDHVLRGGPRRLPVTRITSSLRRPRAAACISAPFVGIEDDLRLAVAVAEVDEHQPAVIAIPLDPAAECGRLADIRRTQFAASLCTQQRTILNRALFALGPKLVFGCHWRLVRQCFSTQRPLAGNTVRRTLAGKPPVPPTSHRAIHATRPSQSPGIIGPARNPHNPRSRARRERRPRFASERPRGETSWRRGPFSAEFARFSRGSWLGKTDEDDRNTQ